jgi:hypothetical protein
VHSFPSCAVTAPRITPGRTALRVPFHLFFHGYFITLRFVSRTSVIVHFNHSFFQVSRGTET